MRKSVDFVGQKFGELVVKSLVGRDKNSHKIYECECSCGVIKNIRASDLKKIVSCGCVLRGNNFAHLHSQHNKGSKSKLWKGCGEISQGVWHIFEKSAKQREIDFKLTIQEGWDLFLKQNRKCALSGLELKFGISNIDLEGKTASLDRIDSNGIYELKNVQWVFKEINLMKRDFDQDKFILLCKQIADFCKNETKRNP